jgi:hypothetical protein
MFDYESPKPREPVDYTGLKIGLMTVPIFIIVTFLSDADAGLAACIVLTAILFAIKIRWHLRKRIWFWVIIAVIFALHIPLLFLARWPYGSVPTIFYSMPIGILDFLIVSGALRLAENLFSNSSSLSDPSR